jgi:uncharacterized RDD family membrane protein YckC
MMNQGSDYNPYQAPTSDLGRADAEEVRAGQARLASRGSRFFASLIDFFIQMLVIVPAQLAFGVYDGFPRVQPQGPLKTAAWALSGFIIYLAFNGYLLAKNGQTIGKLLMRIRIVNYADGSKMPFSKLLLLRILPVQLVALIPVAGGFAALADALMIFRSDYRCLHDHIAGTLVVQS